MTKNLRKQGGFTLVEVTIILLVLVILSSIMLPQLGNFNRLARYVKVKEDLGAICATMKKFLDEVMVRGPFGVPGGGIQAPAVPIGLLVGPGAAPVDNLNPGGSHAPVPGDGAWDLAIGGAAWTETPDIPAGTAAPAGVPFLTDDLEYHLQQNNPLGANSLDVENHYKNAVENFGIAGAFFGWRGPYFDEITSDPWGNRYAVNTFGLHSDGTGNTFSSAVVCYSAGPNGQAETVFNQAYNPGTNYGWLTDGDDEAAVLSAMGPF